MLGFILGTACLLGLFATVRRRRFWHAQNRGFGWGYAHGGGSCDSQWHGHHGGYGPEHEVRERAPFHSPPPGPFGFRGGPGGHGGPRALFRMLRGGPLEMLFDILATTPEQEQILREAAEDLRTRGRAAKGAARNARKSLAQAMRAEAFDENVLGEATSQMDDVVDGARRGVLDAFAKVHGVLDERQRGILADLLERGPRSRFFGGPFRGNGGGWQAEGPYRGRGVNEGGAPWEM